MSYIRGEHYLWADDTRLHVWVADGEDGWRDSDWAESHGGSKAGGIYLPLDVVDDFVVMRLAQLLESETLRAVVDRAVDRHRGNGGCVGLERLAPRIKSALRGVADAEPGDDHPAGHI
jgi:hypothetical protein